MVNREKKRKVEINKEIRTEKWEEYFRKILKRSESKVKLVLKDQERGKEEEREEKEEGKRRRDKRRDAKVRKLKKRKKAREDGLQNEGWI